ncbi:MAG: hypothetical protein J9259_02875 [Thermoplasmata archaeon YP2-bin.285]|uniref:C2H2-type domain-containing protein n=1 Tax=Candidatus Sysuiplasma superficiale TaxID=2823368 RepID=A0A8J8CAH1_9ARCH|nr:hypothetical protein [Candidatus Sysuiplasma superficiale]
MGADMVEKCERCRKTLESPIKLYVHLIEKHGFTEEEARLAAWPKGALL